MKQFLNSSLSRTFQIRFLKTNFRAKHVDKAKFGVSSAVWTVVFHLKLLWALIVFRPKAVYYPITPTAMGWVGRDAPCLLLCRLFRVPTVIHLRGGHLKLNLPTFGRIARKLVRWSCSTVSLALVQANCLKNQFEGLVTTEQIKVLPQAIDCDEYRPADDASEVRPLVLFLGNLSYAKGYCDLLSAMPPVVERMDDVKFVCCGAMIEKPRGVFFDQRTGRRLDQRSPREAHEQISRSKYARNYEWRGVVSGVDKLNLLQSCCIVALPSYSEGFSRAILEAIACGKPVVCTPVGAHAEYIVDGVNGLIVEPGDVHALSSALMSLLSDPALVAKLGANNYRYARESFEIEAVARMLSTYLFQAMKDEAHRGR